MVKKREKRSKKLICAVLLMISVFSFTACGDAKEETGPDGTETTTWNSGDSLITGETKQLTEPPAAWKISEETKLKSEISIRLFIGCKKQNRFYIAMMPKAMDIGFYVADQNVII